MSKTKKDKLKLYIPPKGPHWRKGLYERVKGKIGYDRTRAKKEFSEFLEEDE